MSQRSDEKADLLKKHTWPQKIIALSFIGLILLSNLWLHHYLFGEELPRWTFYAVDTCIFTLCTAGLVQLIFWIKRKLS